MLKGKMPMNRKPHIDYSIGEYDENIRSILENDNSESHSKLKKVMLEVIKNELTPRQKQIIMLYYFKGMNVVEIADMLGINHSSVSITMKRARNRLFRILKYRL
jgi:RNA polymerase sigma-70 factor (ECF subfamily)